MRRRQAIVWTVICGAALVAGACGGGAAKLTELQRVKSNQLEIVLLSAHDILRHGQDAFVIEFRSAADGALVDVGEVKGKSAMAMAGTPMFGSIDVKRTDIAGRYSADAKFDMAGTWRTTVEWQGPSGSGSATFSASVQ